MKKKICSLFILLNNRDLTLLKRLVTKFQNFRRELKDIAVVRMTKYKGLGLDACLKT